MFRTDDPIADFARHEAEQASQLERLPVCDYCNEPIQDDVYFDMDGCLLCEECLNKYHKKNTYDYI